MALPGSPPDRSSAPGSIRVDPPTTEPGLTSLATDWPQHATDTVVRLVDNVRDKTTGPALNIARWLIYGVVLAVLVTPIAVLALIGAMRGLEGILLSIQSATGWSWLLDPIWIVYLFFGSVFCLVGLFCWHKGKQPAPA